MVKAAFIFPGQGSQYVGMGKDLADNFPSARRVFDEAAAYLGGEFVDVILNGPEEKLRQTRFTQPALFIVSMAALEVLREKGLKADFAAGHSLGEYSALCAAGAFDFRTGLDLVKARGEAIEAASAQTPGTMAALIGLDRMQVSHICRQSAAKGVCEAVNFNCPGQIVIAGTVPAIEEAVKLADAAGATKAIQLNVSGPFHSSLMRPAAERMRAVLEKAALKDGAIPVYSNCDAGPTQKADEIRAKLVRQIDHAVLWEDTILEMAKAGVGTFVEVGAGRVLSGLLRRIDKSKKALNIEDKKSADSVFNHFESIAPTGGAPTH